jgi:plastocyanin
MAKILLVAILGAALATSLAAPALAQGANVTVQAQESGCTGGRTFCFDTQTLNGTSGGTITFSNPSTNKSPHSLCLDLPGGPVCTPNSQQGSTPGSQEHLTIPSGTPAGTYAYYCNVPGHRQLGMQGNLTLSAASGGGLLGNISAGGNASVGGTNATGNGNTSATGKATPGLGVSVVVAAAALVAVAARRRGR